MKRQLSTLALLISTVVAVAGTPLAAVASTPAAQSPAASTSPRATTAVDETFVSAPAAKKGANAQKPAGEAIGLIVRYAKGVRPVVSGTVTGSSAVAEPLSVGNDLGDGWRTVTFDETVTADAARAAAAQLAASPLVLEAHPNLMHYLSETLPAEETLATGAATAAATDWTVTTQSSSTWGLGRIDQTSLPLDYSYTYDTTGAEVKAYIVDSGINTTHTEFTGRLATGYHTPGLGSTKDCDGHGTHVAGTVGGTVYGVAKEVTIVPVRVFPCDDAASTVDINNALDWIMDDHQAGTPAVINMSLGGPRDDELDDKIQEVIDSGITVVVAAGNESQNSCDVSPARLPDAITVNASERDDDDADYSNYGACSDLYAPGSAIKSAWNKSNTATATISGTSMASPHVAGLVARILSAEPTLTPAQVWDELNAATSPFDPGLNDDIEQDCEWFGYESGCVGTDPEKILYAGVPVPTGLSPIAGPGSIDLAWNIPAKPDGEIIDYVIEYRSASESTYTTLEDGVSLSPEVTIAALRPAYSHYVRVAAETAAGVGEFSAARVVKTLAVALGKPTAITKTSNLTTVELNWTAPTLSSAAGTISDYLIRYKVAGATRWLTFNDGVSAETSATVGPLSRGKSYDFSIQATIPWKTGTAATLKASTLSGIASAPTNLTTSSITSTSLALQWEAPSTINGAEELTDYIVRYRLKGKTTWTTLADEVSTEASATITPLAPGKSYDVEVKAVTLVGSTSLKGASVTKRFATLS